MLDFIRQKSSLNNRITCNGFLVFFVCLFGGIFVVDPYKENKCHMFFYIVLTFTVCISIYIKKSKIGEHINALIITVLMGEMLLLCIIGGGYKFVSLSELDIESVPNKATTFVERASDGSGYLDSSFTMYYLRNKKILCNEETVYLVDKYLKETYFEYYYNYEIIKDNQICYEKDIEDNIIPYYRYVDYYGNIYVIGKGERIFALENKEGELIFVPEDVYQLFEESSILDSIESTNEDARRELARITSYKNGNFYPIGVNIFANMFFLFIGLVISISFFNYMSGWNIVMLSIPFGIVVWVISGLILVICNMPYNMITQCVSIVIILGIIIYKHGSSFKYYKYIDLIIPFAMLSLGIVYYSVTCHTILSNDSCMKINHGLVLAIDNKPELRFTRMVMYGMIEPFIHSLGFMIGGDYIYSIYPVFFLIGIGLICGGLYEILLYENHVVNVFKYRFWFLLTFLSVGLLITNIDVKYAKYYVMSHILMSVYFLIIVFFVVMRKEAIDKDNYVVAILLSTIAIIVTRTEGIMYVLFMVTFFAGYIHEKRYFKTGYVICGLSIIWTIIQLLMFDGDTGGGYFFSEKKCVLLILCSLLSTLFLFLITKNKLRFITERNYSIKYLMAILVGIVLVSFSVKDMAKVNWKLYISHLSSYIELGYNSGLLWGGIFLSLAVLIVINKPLSKITAGYILGYLGLLFLIFLFRKDLPIREGIGDSCRRLIVQVMPASIFLITASFLMEMKDTIKCEGSKDI